MFDKTFVTHRTTEYVPYTKNVTVTEKRAPTDESIKLFKELQEKAINSIADVIQVKNNIVEGCILKITKSPIDLSQYYKVAFKINDKNFVINFSVEEHPYDDKYLVKKFNEVFTEKLKLEIFGETLKQGSVHVNKIP